MLATVPERHRLNLRRKPICHVHGIELYRRKCRLCTDEARKAIKRIRRGS
jgi:hypothetical protein